MIIEVPIEEFIRPRNVVDDNVEVDEFNSDDQQVKNLDFTFEQQDEGFKEGLTIAISDKNINISKRPGFLTIDMDRREEPQVAHPEYENLKESFDVEFKQYE